VSRIKRSSLFPDLPTWMNRIEGFPISTPGGPRRPTGVPQSVIDKLNPVLRRSSHPDVQKKFQERPVSKASPPRHRSSATTSRPLGEMAEDGQDANIQAD